MTLRRAAQLWLNSVAVVVTVGVVLAVPVAGAIFGNEAGHPFVGLTIALLIEITIAAIVIA